MLLAYTGYLATLPYNGCPPTEPFLDLFAALFILISKELKPDIDLIHPIWRLGGEDGSHRDVSFWL